MALETRTRARDVLQAARLRTGARCAGFWGLGPRGGGGAAREASRAGAGTRGGSASPPGAGDGAGTGGAVGRARRTGTAMGAGASASISGGATRIVAPA